VDGGAKRGSFVGFDGFGVFSYEPVLLVGPIELPVTVPLTPTSEVVRGARQAAERKTTVQAPRAIKVVTFIGPSFF
jgi:hypothetical protein